MTTAILDTRLAARLAIASPQGAARDLPCLFVLDRQPAVRQLVCHWHLDADDRLACTWEPDIVPVPPL